MMTSVLGGLVSRLMQPRQPPPLPERPCDEASACDTPIIHGIIRALMQNHRPEPLEENKPHREMESDLPPPGRFVIGPKADPPIDEKINRQRHGHGQGVVEMTVKERGIIIQVRLDERAVDDVSRKADEKNRIEPVSKAPAFFRRHRESPNWPPS